MKNVLLTLCFGFVFVTFSYAENAEVIRCSSKHEPCPDGLICDVQRDLCIIDATF
jgi:hypothetical protein